MRRRLVLLISLLFLPTFVPAARAADLRFFEDATLRAVQFVDDREGWAVGDEGVIWHTIDGGKSWERQASGTRASLRSVHFLPPYIGWAVGREELPHGRGSSGVLLFTRDGGLTWKRLLANSLPGLNHVRFVDQKNGFVLGDGTDLFGSGVFRTTDGGKTWEPVSGPRAATWLAGDFQDGNTGLLAGAWSRLATLRQNQFGTAEVDTLGGRSILGMQILPKKALAVGQGGLVLSSVSGGARWGFADLKLPAEVLANLDFHAVHAVGPRVWIVGRPGSAVLASDDAGATWKLHKTGQGLPLHGVHFVNEKQGWAVGALGTILATTDGGQTWKSQQHGGQRAAVLAVHAGPQQVPLETLAKLGGDEGYLTNVLRLTAPDAGSSTYARAAEAQRFDFSMRRAGAAGGEMLWQFPLPQHLASVDRKELLEAWNQLHGGQGDQQLLRQLVLALRTWRPEVVVTDHPDQATGDAAGALLAEALHEAIKQAGDPTAFPEQIEQLGLAAWKAKKLYAAWGRDQAQITLDNDAPLPRLSGSARDFAADAAGVLWEEARRLPATRSFRLLSGPDGAERGKHFLDGLTSVEGDNRRKVGEEIKESPELRQALQQRRHLQILAEKIDDPNKTLAQILPTLAKLPDDQAAPAAFAIASQYARQGHWTLAREAYLMMVDRYPAHPLAADAYRWLVKHIGSSEARRRHELGQFLVVANVTFRNDLGDGPLKKDSLIQQVKGVEEVRNGTLAYLTSKEETRHWYRGSFEIGKRLAGFGPLYANDPAIQFCLQAARRQLDPADVSAAKEWFTKFTQHGPAGPWRDAAAAELWLTNRAMAQPRKVALCRRLEQRPHLDGKFDDPCWQGLRPMILEDAVGQTSKQNYVTEARLGYDDGFLYVALTCKHPPGRRVPPVKDRQRDDNLNGHDRVSLLLDLDRDYSTYFHLQMDQRGCVREDCWGDPGWNPRWFVAVHSDETSWNIEAAIPLTELTGERIPLGNAWAFNLTRIVPGRGVQSWNLPADVQPRPEGMGLLIFHQDAPARPAPK